MFGPPLPLEAQPSREAPGFLLSRLGGGLLLPGSPAAERLACTAGSRAQGLNCIGD